MVISSITECSFREVCEVKLDLAICASGYEQRASFIAEQLGSRVPSKKVLAFSVGTDLGSRAVNDNIYDALGYGAVLTAGNSDKEIRRIVREQILGSNKVRNVVVDISSMTRYWYASILDELRRSHISASREISVFFTYVPSKYERPPVEQPPNVSFGAIPGFTPIVSPELPTAVIIGLGHEHDKALGVAEYVDAKETYAFVADPAFYKSFVKDVLKVNRQFLEHLPSGHIVHYPLHSITNTGLLLNSLGQGLLSSYRLILVPLGPKPFSLLCFLFAIMNPETSVWRVSAEEEEPVATRAPREPPLVCRVEFSEEGVKRK